MLERVAEFINRYNMLARGQAVGVAVSGGADSVCLLHVLAELAPHWALRLVVLHLNHGLRGEESDQDEAFVKQLAASLGLNCLARRVDVGLLRRMTGDNLEQAARAARREFFLDCMRQAGLGRVALGHTRSDQAETVLLRLMRGSGPEGLAGILPVTQEGFIRPLLGVERAEVEQYLRDRNIAWREDSTNRDLALARNRIRHQVLPVLLRDFNPALVGALARYAELAQTENDFWKCRIERLARRLLERRPPAVLVRADRLAGLPAAVGRRLVRYILEKIKGDLRRIEFEHVEQILRLAAEKSGHGRLQVPDVEVIRSFNWLRIVRLDQVRPPQPYSLNLDVPAELVLEGGLRLVVSVAEWNGEPGGLDLDRVPRPLVVRNWRPGDRYRPAGRDRAVLIKKMFQEQKIPLWERSGWPVLTGGDLIVWSRQFGPAAEYAAAPGCRRVIRLEVSDINTNC